jgi:hypothetical protein
MEVREGANSPVSLQYQVFMSVKEVWGYYEEWWEIFDYETFFLAVKDRGFSTHEGESGISSRVITSTLLVEEGIENGLL